MLNIPSRYQYFLIELLITKIIPEVKWFNTFEQAGILQKILNIKYVFN